jgi:hypothetical protein
MVPDFTIFGDVWSITQVNVSQALSPYTILAGHSGHPLSASSLSLLLVQTI